LRTRVWRPREILRREYIYIYWSVYTRVFMLRFRIKSGWKRFSKINFNYLGQIDNHIPCPEVIGPLPTVLGGGSIAVGEYWN
jgi:hypothetical protein